MLDLLAYCQFFLFFLAIAISGILIFRKFIDYNGAQLLFPTGIIFGIAFYIFQINLYSHFLKGTPNFVISLIIQVIIAAYLNSKNKQSAISYPKGRYLIYWIASLSLWAVFFYQITAHSIIDGADSTIYYSLASRFSRGDFPILQPWQPDFVVYNHIGGPELLGAFKAIINTPYYFQHAFLAFICLLSITQILTWLPKRNVNSLVKFTAVSIPAIFVLISLGAFMIPIPINLNFPDLTIEWVRKMPTLAQAFESYGSPTTLDAFILFLHRFLAFSLFITILVPLVHFKNKHSLFPITILISALALVDETIFLPTIIPILILIFGACFKKSYFQFLLYTVIVILLTIFQGGILTETVLNRYHQESQVLFFPNDGPRSTEQYKSYRLPQQNSYLFRDQKYSPFNWFHPSPIQQIFVLFLIAIFYKKIVKKNLELIQVFWLFVLSSIVALILYNGLVPKGYTHTNGNRFLTLSIQLSGAGIGLFISSWLFNLNTKRKLNLILAAFTFWILIGSIIPPLANIFPRKKENYLEITKTTPNPLFVWVKGNISKDQRVISLTDNNPLPASNIDLVKETGTLTPIWDPEIRVHDSFDMSPIYADLYYSLNPEILKILKVDYVITNSQYLEKLPAKRLKDLENENYFKTVFTNGNTIIRKIQEKYLSEGENFDGTFTQLKKLTFTDKTYFIDYPPNITENVYRILRLLLYDRKIYYNPQGAFYNARIDVPVNYHGEGLTRYDYLILGQNVDPASICKCDATLIWSGLGNGVKLWRTSII